MSAFDLFKRYPIKPLPFDIYNVDDDDNVKWLCVELSSWDLENWVILCGR